MISKIVKVNNATGFHVRPASVFVRAAESCKSTVRIIHGNSIINGKSLLNILSAAISKGEEIEICCEGPEEERDIAYLLEKMNHLED